jgi:uncharacterized BrkB/YihY/UPF0761 family membrane protein
VETKSPANAKIAGILSIIAGVSALFGSLVLGAIGVAGSAVLGSAGHAPHGLPLLPLLLFVPLSVLIFALGVIAIIGGVYGVRREHFWVLVIGAAAAVFCFLPLGIAALVFTVLAEKEFTPGAAPGR